MSETIIPAEEYRNSQSPSRREFLKLGLAAAVAALLNEPYAAAAQKPKSAGETADEYEGLDQDTFSKMVKTYTRYFYPDHSLAMRDVRELAKKSFADFMAQSPPVSEIAALFRKKRESNPKFSIEELLEQNLESAHKNLAQAYQILGDTPEHNPVQAKVSGLLISLIRNVPLAAAGELKKPILLDGAIELKNFKFAYDPVEFVTKLTDMLRKSNQKLETQEAMGKIIDGVQIFCFDLFGIIAADRVSKAAKKPAPVGGNPFLPKG